MLHLKSFSQRKGWNFLNDLCYNSGMSKRLNIDLDDQLAEIAARESALQGISLEEYTRRTLAQQALRDKIKRAEEEGGELTIDEVCDPLIAKYEAMIKS